MAVSAGSLAESDGICSTLASRTVGGVLVQAQAAVVMARIRFIRPCMLPAWLTARDEDLADFKIARIVPAGRRGKVRWQPADFQNGAVAARQPDTVLDMAQYRRAPSRVGRYPQDPAGGWQQLGGQGNERRVVALHRPLRGASCRNRGRIHHDGVVKRAALDLFLHEAFDVGDLKAEAAVAHWQSRKDEVRARPG